MVKLVAKGQLTSVLPKQGWQCGLWSLGENKAASGLCEELVYDVLGGLSPDAERRARLCWPLQPEFPFMWLLPMAGRAQGQHRVHVS